jgi:hypothetical protein
MATTTNYGWTTPDDTALVKDGASAIRSLGSAIDTTVFANSKILQVVRGTDATARSTTSTSMVDASISVTITPKKNTSNILIVWVARTSHQSTSDFSLYSITDASNVAIAGAETGVLGSNTTGRVDASIVLMGWASPATISATTYKGRFRVETSGTNELRNNLQTGQLFAIEVAP